MLLDVQTPGISAFDVLEMVGPERMPAVVFVTAFDEYDRFLVRRGSGLAFVLVGDVEWVEAQGNYAALHVGPKTHLVRDTLTHLEGRLDPRQFVRVRRTALVSVNHVAALDPWQKDEHVVVLRSGTRIPVGRAFLGRVERVLAACRV